LSERRSKFFGLVVFIVLIVGFSYLMITGSKANHKEVYTQIKITENTLLPADEYLRYAGLSDSKKYGELTLLEVKTKIEKHPYLRKAEVEFDGINTILVEVQEKEIKAVLLQKNELMLITSDSETLPLFPPTAINDLPMISNLSPNGKKSFSDEEIESAFRIIDAISLSDTNVRKNLAEINLRKGGDVILTFTGLQYPVLFGKSNEIRKALILKELWQDLNDGANSSEKPEYLDLRYNNKVFIGKRKTQLTNG
jgi:cell division septal protein FtsQ